MYDTFGMAMLIIICFQRFDKWKMTEKPHIFILAAGAASFCPVFYCFGGLKGPKAHKL